MTAGHPFRKILIRAVQAPVLGHPGLVLALLLILSAIAGAFLPRLATNPSPRLLAPGHPSRVAATRLEEEFTGSKSSILIMLSVEGTREKTIFNPRTLERVRDLTRALEAIHLIGPAQRKALKAAAARAPKEIFNGAMALAAAPIDTDTWLRVDELKEAMEFSHPLPELEGVLAQWQEDLFPIESVDSLFSTDNILARDNRLVVEPIYQNIPATPAAMAHLRQEVISNDLFTGVLVSNHEQNTGIQVELTMGEEAVDKRRRIFEQVETIITSRVPGPEKIHVAGMPIVTSTLSKTMEKDSKKLFAMVTLMVSCCLFVTFRGIRGVVMPLAVVLLSLTVTLGVKAFFNIPLNIITISLPVFVLSIGVADGIHIYSEFRDHILAGEGRQRAVALTLEHLSLPVIMTSLTTGAAFYAISMTQIVQLHHCGLFVCLGALVAMVFSLFFIPALLMVLPEAAGGNAQKSIQDNPHENLKDRRQDKIYTRILLGLTRAVLKNPGPTLALFFTILGIFIHGALKVVVDNNSVAFFKPDSPVFQASQALNTEGVGSSRINFVIQAKPNKGNEDQAGTPPFKRPENLVPVARFIDFLNRQPEMGKAAGLTDLIQRIHFVLNDQIPGENRLPADGKRDDPNLIPQLILLYENGGGDTLSDFVNPDYTRLNIPAVLRTNSSRETQFFTQRVLAANLLPPHLRLEITGTARVEAATTEEIVKGQITGLTVSILVVLIMLGITFRRLDYTLIAMVPLLVTITINFGVMGYLKIPLDIGTAIIASMVIGIGVDYSIHYLSRLTAGLEAGLDFDAAVAATVRHSGKAIVSNALTVGFGFLALWFASLVPLMVMGWLITLTMGVAALAALVLLPVFVQVHRSLSAKESTALAGTIPPGPMAGARKEN